MLSLMLAGGAVAASDQVTTGGSGPGFIVAAPDRGFVGNGEMRSAFSALEERYPAALVFVTDERTRESLKAAVGKLASSGVERAVLLPMYLSLAHPDFQRLREGIADAEIPVRIAHGFGQSALAVATLAERFEHLPADTDRVVVAGVDEGSDRAAMAADLERLAASASDRFDFSRPEVLLTGEDPDALARQLAALDDETVVVPFHLGRKLDSMMSHTARIRHAAPETITVADGGVTPHPAVGAWMLREAARHALDPASDESGKIGVIVHAHGSDFHWNERMREAASPLAEHYLVEYAFSMADPSTLRTATDRLVQRGAEAVVLVRVFGMADSFRAGIERLIGADYENCAVSAHAGHGHHHGQPAPRIVAPVPIVTVGGLEDHPLFARALLDRAMALSQQPDNETVIVVAHGKRADADDAQWMQLLDSIRRQMQEAGGDAFNAIEIGTWREDWDDKREAAVARIRGLIEQARARGNRVIVVPARTNAQGPARRLIPDLDYALAEGFAGHRLFPQWLDAQVRAGLEAIEAGTSTTGCDGQAGSS